MLTFLYCYIAASLLVGVVAIPGFWRGSAFIRHCWWASLMLVCPLSWLVVTGFFTALGFYKSRAKKGGAPC